MGNRSRGLLSIMNLPSTEIGKPEDEILVEKMISWVLIILSLKSLWD